MDTFSRSGQIVDLIAKEIYPGTLYVKEGIIQSIERTATPQSDQYLLPGFIDAHVHIESSMLIPSEFARLASVHGTVATVSDPHEIANILGLSGIRYMIENGAKVPFHFYFGASSCVPATQFETSGANLSASEIEELFKVDRLKYLSEMMNYPGVLNKDSMVMEKLAVAKKWKVPIDGHAPGLLNEEAARYISAGISTDHECFTFEEAKHKADLGMHILIREGSAAKNYEALHPLIGIYPHLVMFCSDDKHPNDLVKGHINELVKRSLSKGYDLMDVLRAASLNPIRHYNLEVGLLQPGDSADFIIVDNLSDLKILETFVKGTCIASHSKTHIASIQAETPNHFQATYKNKDEFAVPASRDPSPIRVIQALEGQLVTQQLIMKPKIENGLYVADLERDLLKLAVVNRYKNCPPAVAFISNFGLKKGAIASCVAHDSHNMIVVGCSDEEIAEAVNLLISQKGGIAVVNGNQKFGLPLPVGGIMSNQDGYRIANQYADLDSKAKALGTELKAPFMTLSFMALLVIPSIKLSDLGLFDGTKFEFISLEAKGAQK